jgi:hypothetical protein
VETAPATEVQRATAASLAARCPAVSVCLGTLVSAAHTKFRTPRPLGLSMGWWMPAAWSRLVTVRSRRGCPSADTPVTRSHVAAARTASARQPGPYLSPCRSRIARLHDRRAIALWGLARLVRLSPSSPRPLRCRRVASDASLGHGSHCARPATRAPTARPAGIARAWKARMRGRRKIALWGTAGLVRSSPSPLLRLAADEILSRPWGRNVDLKCSKARRAPFSLLGSSCHAASSARIVLVHCKTDAYQMLTGCVLDA